MPAVLGAAGWPAMWVRRISIGTRSSLIGTWAAAACEVAGLLMASTGWPRACASRDGDVGSEGWTTLATANLIRSRRYSSGLRRSSRLAGTHDLIASKLHGRGAGGVLPAKSVAHMHSWNVPSDTVPGDRLADSGANRSASTV